MKYSITNVFREINFSTKTIVTEAVDIYTLMNMRNSKMKKSVASVVVFLYAKQNFTTFSVF